jgi:hypothetical protein
MFWKHLVWTAVALILVLGDVGTVVALEHPLLGKLDGQVLKMAAQDRAMTNTGNNPLTNSLPVVRYVNSHPHLTILADTFIDWPVVVRSHQESQFVITSDYDFASILENPRGRVSAILVPQPVGVARLDAINRAWPGLWAGQVPWTRLIKDFPGGVHYRLYKVLPTAP